MRTTHNILCTTYTVVRSRSSTEYVERLKQGAFLRSTPYSSSCPRPPPTRLAWPDQAWSTAGINKDPAGRLMFYELYFVVRRSAAWLLHIHGPYFVQYSTVSWFIIAYQTVSKATEIFGLSCIPIEVFFLKAPQFQCLRSCPDVTSLQFGVPICYYGGGSCWPRRTDRRGVVDLGTKIANLNLAIY